MHIEKNLEKNHRNFVEMASVDDDMFATDPNPPPAKQSSLFADLAPPSSSAVMTKNNNDNKRSAVSSGDQHTSNKKVRKAGEGGGSTNAGGTSQAGKSSGTAISAAYSEDKGSRKEMEDIAVIKLDAGEELATSRRVSFFGVFDGHGGRQVAHHVAEHIHSSVLAAGLKSEVTAGSAPPNVKACRAAITAGFKALDEAILKKCAAEEWADGATAVAVWVVGETVLVGNVGDAKCVLARRPQGHGHVAPPADSGNPIPSPGAAAPAGSEGEGNVQAGNSQGTDGGKQGEPAARDAEEGRRAATNGGPPPSDASAPCERHAGEQHGAQEAPAAAQGGGTAGRPPGGTDAQPSGTVSQLEQYKAITLTREHKAIFPQERQRIERMGGSVSADGRLAGRIEVSRAFGDRAFKKLGMTVTPDIQAFQIGPRDAFMLCGCDGFWGVFGAQDAVDFAAREMAKGYDVKQTCNRLIYEAIRERHCKDNCTVMLIKFGG